MIRSSRAFLAALLAAQAQGALGEEWPGFRNEVANETWMGSGPASPSAPRRRQVGNGLDASFGLGKGLSLDLSLGLTWIEDTGTALQRRFPPGNEPVLDLGAGLTWEASERIALQVAGGYSPRSRLVSDSAVSYPGVGGQTSADALVAADSSTASAAVAFSYDTAGYSDYETGVDLGLAGRRLDTDQHAVAIRGPGGQAIAADQLAQDLRRSCQGNVRACPRQLLGLLNQRPATLHQLALKAGVVETLWLDTALGLSGSWYLYDRNPTAVGFFQLADAGRGAAFGNGVAMAPLSWSLRPSLARRLGDFLLRAWWEHGAYVQDQGSLDALGLRVQYRWSPAFRVWIAASLQRDRDRENGATSLVNGALGALFRW
jgi:hypothetical protein